MAIYNERIPHVKQPLPKKKGNRKVLILLFVFFISVLSVVFFRSPYSKVSDIQVFGNSIYSKQEIIAASNMFVGMQFLNVWESNAEEVLVQLKGVKEVTLDREFPGVIKVDVKEYRRVAFVSTPKGEYFPLLENGEVLQLANNKDLMLDQPIVRSWSAPDLLKDLGKQLAKLPNAILYQISDISLTPTMFDKQRVTLFMRDGNEVRSVIYQLGKKLPWYPSIVKEIPKGEKGVIHMFESTWYSKYGSPDTNSAATEKSNATDQANPNKETMIPGQATSKGQTETPSQP